MLFFVFINIIIGFIIWKFMIKCFKCDITDTDDSFHTIIYYYLLACCIIFGIMLDMLLIDI